MHGNLLKFLNIFKLCSCFFVTGKINIPIRRNGNSGDISRHKLQRLEAALCTSWVAVAVISSTVEVCRGALKSPSLWYSGRNDCEPLNTTKSYKLINAQRTNYQNGIWLECLGLNLNGLVSKISKAILSTLLNPFAYRGSKRWMCGKYNSQPLLFMELFHGKVPRGLI